MKNKCLKVSLLIAVILIIIISIITLVIRNGNKKVSYDNYSKNEEYVNATDIAAEIENNQDSSIDSKPIEITNEYDNTIAVNYDMTNNDIINAISDYVSIENQFEQYCIYSVVEFLGPPYLVSSTATKINFFPESGYTVLLSINNQDVCIVIDESNTSYVRYRLLN